MRGHLTVAAHGMPGDLYVYGQGKNISMADWAALILRVGEEHGFWPDDRHVVTTEKRLRPGASDVMALRVGYEKLNRETGWEPKVSWEDGVSRTIALVRRATATLDRPRRLARQASRPDHVSAIVDGRVTWSTASPSPTPRPASPYREQWEKEAADDHVRSAIANAPAGAAADELLTGQDRTALGPLPGQACTSARCSISAQATGASTCTSRGPRG